MNMRYIGPNISFIFTKIKELMNSHNTNSSAHSELFKSWTCLRNPTNAEIADALAATYKNGIGDVLVEVKDDTTFALKDIKLFFRPARFQQTFATQSLYEGIYITMDGTQGRYLAKIFADSEVTDLDGITTIVHNPSQLVLYPVASDAILYTAQSLTNAQKQQARTNIGAVSESDVNDKLPIYIKMMLINNNSNVVIAEDGTTGGQILGYLTGGREVRLIYDGFTYYLSKQGTESGTTTLTSLSFAACADTPSDDNPNGDNVLSRITYDFNKHEFTVTVEGRYINPIDGIVKSDLSADIQKTLDNANATTETGVGLIRYIKMVDADTTGSGIVVPDNSDETYYTIKQYINSGYTVILLYKGVPYSLNYTKLVNNNISLYYFHAIVSSDATSTADTASEIKTVVAGNNLQFKVTTKPLYISATVSNNTLIIR